MLNRTKNLACLLLLLVFSGCSTLPVDNDKPASEVFGSPEATALGRHFLPDDLETSRFHVLSGGLDAFKKRLALAELTERSLDIQTYVWRLDETGKALLQRALLAADRGARVRILLDDVRAAPDENTWLSVHAHANVEVRFFNPLGNRKLRILDALVDGRRINRRMHNKLMVFDESVAILGGRNIGDHYFGVNIEQNFRDMDLLIAGRSVDELAVDFDRYWNSPWALPVSTLAGRHASPESARLLRETLALEFPEIDELYIPSEPDPDAAWALAAGLESDMLTAAATVVTDPPGKVRTGAFGDVAGAIDAAIADVEEELLIEAAYFIPPRESREALSELVDRDTRVILLTNSLATTDVALAHSGYKKHQRALLESGVEIYEMRPDARADRKRWSVLASDSLAALHTKALVFDRSKVFIGSYNFDPRSRNINTENGIIVKSRELAEAVAELIEAGRQAENSYRLLLDGRKVTWQLEDGDEVHVFRKDPETGALKRIVTGILRVLPIESQL